MVRTKTTWVDGWLPDAVAVLIAVLATHPLVHHLNALVDHRRGSIYGTLAGLHGTLLGFELAALTIVLGYAQQRRFDLVRQSGHFPTMFAIYLAGVRTQSAALLLAVASLLVDRDSRPIEWMTSVVLALSCLAGLRLARVLWVTHLVVDVVTAPNERKPGAVS